MPKSAQHWLLLFDIDGTLLDAAGAGFRAMTRAGQLVFGHAFSLKGVSFAGSLDPSIFREGALQSGFEPTEANHASFRDAYLPLLEQELAAAESTIEPLPGVLALLHELRSRERVMLGLLTGNYRRAAELKLERIGLQPSWFPIGAFGDAAPSRPELVPVARQQYATLFASEPHAIVVIGDTPRDVACARANGCRVLAVATGRYSVSELEAAGADSVSSNLCCAEVLWEWLGDMA